MINRPKQQSVDETNCSLQLNNGLVQDISYLTVKDVAGILKVSSDTVYRLLDNRKIPFYLFGGCKRIKLSDLKEYLDLCFVQASK